MKKSGKTDSSTPAPVEGTPAESAKTRVQREPDRLRQLDLLMKKLEKAQKAKQRLRP